MKKTILAIALVLTSFAMNAQEGVFISLGGGPTYQANTKVLSTSEGALKGSYGEGKQIQIRGGYFFNDKFGAELGIGYLHGDTQVIRDNYLRVEGRARAFGAALSGIYNVTKNVYVKAGVLTKIGGKSENNGSLNTLIPAINPKTGAPIFNPKTGEIVKKPLNVEFDRDGKGKLPIGFIAAMGVRHQFNNSNWGIFAEMEYQGINVTPDSSTLNSYSASIAGQPVTDKNALLAQAQALIGAGAVEIKAEDLLSISDKFTYSDNPDPATQRKTFDVPYSSLGFTFGVTYFLGNKTSKDKK